MPAGGLGRQAARRAAATPRLLRDAGRLLGQRRRAGGARRAGLAHRAGERPRSATASSTLPVAANRLAGKTAIISGAGQAPGLTVGKGRAMQLLFAREGANLVLLGRDETSAAAPAEIAQARPVERRVGVDCVSRCQYRWSPFP